MGRSALPSRKAGGARLRSSRPGIGSCRCRNSLRPNQGGDMPTNAELLQNTYEAFGRGDIPAVLAVLDEHIVWNAPDVLPHAIPVAGRDDAAKFFQSLASTWEEFGLEIDDVVASGDRVCMIGRAGGTIDGRQ